MAGNWPRPWARPWASGVRTGGTGCSGEADGDAEAVRDDLRTDVLARLGEEAGILVIEETGFLNKGKKSAGGAPQDSGSAGGRANCQMGVFLLGSSSGMPAPRGQPSWIGRCSFQG